MVASATKVITETDILSDLKAYVERFDTKKEAADSFEVSRVFLWKVLKGNVPPTESMLDKLGYKRERTITYTYKKVR